MLYSQNLIIMKQHSPEQGVHALAQLVLHQMHRKRLLRY